MPTVLVTGANRGLGLEFTRQYAAAGWRVLATCRTPDGAPALDRVAAEHGDRIAIHRLDVDDRASVDALAAGLGESAIDLLLNNAGTAGKRPFDFGAIDYADWARTLAINTLAPLRVIEALVDAVGRSERRVIATLSSRMGSIGENDSGGAYAYRSSKAALNAALKSLAIDLARRRIVVVALHPGWVATDMGGDKAPLSPTESVTGLRRVIEDLGAADTGRFLSYDGDEIAW